VDARSGHTLPTGTDTWEHQQRGRDDASSQSLGSLGTTSPNRHRAHSHVTGVNAVTVIRTTTAARQNDAEGTSIVLDRPYQWRAANVKRRVIDQRPFAGAMTTFG